jgi:hypothetical protein
MFLSVTLTKSGAQQISSEGRKKKKQGGGRMCTEFLNHLLSNFSVVLSGENLLHSALHCLGDVVNVLRLDDGLQIVFQNLREVVLKFGTTEIGQNFLPIGRVLSRSLEVAFFKFWGRKERKRNCRLTSNFPRFGFNFPAKIFSAVDFPMPFVPTNPRTCPGRGMGSLEKEGKKNHS